LEYSDAKVMDHFMNPRNVGVIEDADGVGRTGNPVCGDLMEMSVKIEGRGHHRHQVPHFWLRRSHRHQLDGH
jgi:NifU-like protein involved in Fe-S cluster formation